MGAQPIASLAPSPSARTPVLLRLNPESKPDPDFAAKTAVDSLLQAGDWSEAQRHELASLAAETDPQLFWQGLIGFGTRLELSELYPAAAQVYATVAGLSESFRDRAQRRYDALVGQGAFGPRFEFLLRRFCRDAADPKVILPMLAGSAVYSLARATTLSRLATASPASWFARGWGARLSAATVGLAFEVPTFTLGARALQSAAGDPTASLGHDLATAALSLGLLKTFSFAGQRGQRTLLGSPELGLVAAATPAVKLPGLMLAPGASLLGLWTAHRLETALGLRPWRDQATESLDTLSSWLAMGIGSRWGQALLGPRFARIQADLELRAESAVSIQGSAPLPALARPVGKEPVLLGPQLMAMSGGGKNGFELPGAASGHSWLHARQLVTEARRDAKALERLVQAARENPYALEQLETLARERLPGATEGLAELAKTNASALLKLAQLANKRHRLATDLLLGIGNLAVPAGDPEARATFRQALPFLVQAGHPQAAAALAHEAKEHPPSLDWLYGLAEQRKPGALEALWVLARSREPRAVSRLATLLEIRRSEQGPPTTESRRRITAANRLRQDYAKGKADSLEKLARLAESDSYALTQLTILALNEGDRRARDFLIRADLIRLSTDYQPAGQRVEWLLAMAYAGNRSAKALLKTVDLAPLAGEISNRLGTRKDFSANLVRAFGDLGPFEKILEKRLIPQLDIVPLTQELERNTAALGSPSAPIAEAPKYFRGDLEILLYLAQNKHRPARDYLRTFDMVRVPAPYVPADLIAAIRQLQRGKK